MSDTDEVTLLELLLYELLVLEMPPDKAADEAYRLSLRSSPSTQQKGDPDSRG